MLIFSFTQSMECARGSIERDGWTLGHEGTWISGTGSIQGLELPKKEDFVVLKLSAPG